MSERPPALVAEGLCWTYRGARQPALLGLTFDLAAGRVLLVLGPSGSGKSTLARALAGIVPHALAGTWEGALRVGDDDVPATPAGRLGQRVGLVFQDPESQLVMPRVGDEVAFGLENRAWPRQAMLQRVPEALALAGLTGFERRLSRGLSGGEQQRLALAGVLAPLPGLLVFDEPTANLDPPGMVAFFERLRALAAGGEHTIVIIEHRLEAALPLADAVLLLDDAGRQLAFGAPAEVGPLQAGALERLGGWVPAAWWDGQGGRAEEGTGAVPPTPPGAPGGPAAGAAERPGAEVARVEDVVVRYGSSPEDRRTALDGVNLVARAGERVALVGPNGSGKSTLLAVLAGVQRPQLGRAGIVGPGGALVDPARLGSADLPDLIGLVFQDPELGFVARRVADEVGATLTGRIGAGPPGEVVATLGRFGLAGLEERDPFRLSQGQQRRLGLAALAVRRPRLLLLDEPTFGLDRRGTRQVVALLEEGRSAGQAQVLATHDPRMLPACDRVLALDGGHVVFDGASATFLADPPFRPAAPWRLPR